MDNCPVIIRTDRFYFQRGLVLALWSGTVALPVFRGAVASPVHTAGWMCTWRESQLQEQQELVPRRRGTEAQPCSKSKHLIFHLQKFTALHRPICVLPVGWSSTRLSRGSRDSGAWSRWSRSCCAASGNHGAGAEEPAPARSLSAGACEKLLCMGILALSGRAVLSCARGGQGQLLSGGPGAAPAPLTCNALCIVLG